MEEFDEKTKELAWTAYHAYGEDADWTNFTGTQMPSWIGLPDETKRHWFAAVRSVLNKVNNDTSGNTRNSSAD